MTNSAVANKSAGISTTAARLAIGAILVYQSLLIVLVFLRPDLDPSWHTISEWAIGPYGWIMSGAFLISAVSYAFLFVMLRSQLQGAMGRIGLGILLICVIGAVGVGIFTTDPMPLRNSLSTVGTLHLICGTSQLVLLPFAALLINLSLVFRNQIWASARRVLLRTACLPLFGFLSFAFYTGIFVAPMGPHAYGPGVNIGWPPRIAFLTYALWVVILASQAIKCNDQCPAEDHLAGRNRGLAQFQNADSEHMGNDTEGRRPLPG
jgi:hypothetical protein